MGCDDCREKKAEPVPYVVHESAMARNERFAKRLWVALLVAIGLLFASNALWLYAWTSYDYAGEESSEIRTFTQDGEGINIIGDRNGVLTDGPESDD